MNLTLFGEFTWNLVQKLGAFSGTNTHHQNVWTFHNTHLLFLVGTSHRHQYRQISIMNLLWHHCHGSPSVPSCAHCCACFSFLHCILECHLQIVSAVKVRCSPNAIYSCQMAQDIHEYSFYGSATGYQRAAAGGTMPISFKTASHQHPSVCNQWSGFLQKPHEIPGSGVVFEDILYYFKAQSRIKGEISLP